MPVVTTAVNSVHEPRSTASQSGQIRTPVWPVRIRPSRSGVERSHEQHRISRSVGSVMGLVRVAVDDGVVREQRRFRSSPAPRRDSFGVHELLVAYFAGDVDALETIETATPRARRSSTRCGPACARFRRARPPRTASSPRGSASRARHARSVWRTRRTRSPLIVPCHRVIRTGGALGGYGGGLPLKARPDSTTSCRYSMGTRGMTLAPTRSKISSRL